MKDSNNLGVFLIFLSLAVTMWGVVGTSYEGSHMFMFRKTNKVVRAIVTEVAEQASTPMASPMPRRDPPFTHTRRVRLVGADQYVLLRFSEGRVCTLLIERQLYAVEIKLFPFREWSLPMCSVRWEE